MLKTQFVLWKKLLFSHSRSLKCLLLWWVLFGNSDGRGHIMVAIVTVVCCWQDWFQECAACSTSIYESVLILCAFINTAGDTMSSDVPGPRSDFSTVNHPRTLTSKQLKARLYATPEVLNNLRPQFQVFRRRKTEEVISKPPVLNLSKLFNKPGGYYCNWQCP
jgi:hypothetical protein